MPAPLWQDFVWQAGLIAAVLFILLLVVKGEKK